MRLRLRRAGVLGWAGNFGIEAVGDLKVALRRLRLEGCCRWRGMKRWQRERIRRHVLTLRSCPA